MRKYICVLLLLVFVAWQCQSVKKKEKTFYFYNAKELFHQNIVSNDSVNYIDYAISKSVPPIDSFGTGGGNLVYGLVHYYKLSFYYYKLSYYRDTFFVKPKSYLDNIDYYDTAWFNKEDNLYKFWKTCSGRFDSLKIYAIEPIEGTDSLIFRRVHRYFFPAE